MRFSIFSITLFAISFNHIHCINVSSNLGRIARGLPATIRQFPYTVRMHIRNGQSKQKKLCGAALIGTSWLLTAAHCLYDAIAIEVYLGSLFIDDAKVAYKVPISNIAIHPNFHKGYFGDDIALLKIPPIELCEELGIVPLPKIQPAYSTYENYAAKGSGWGAINDEGVHPKRLQWGRMQILSNEECGLVDVMNELLCTATNSDWATICPGDSGGPLILESTGELVGIASSGDPESCERGEPAIFTRVTSYLDWIKTVSDIFYE